MKFFIGMKNFLLKGTLVFLLSTPIICLADSAAGTGSKNADTLLNDYYSLRIKDPTSARMILMQAVQNFPNQELIQSELGYLLLREGNFQEALVHFKEAHRINPNNSGYTMQIGYTLNALHRNAEANNYFREVATTTKGIDAVKAQDILQRQTQTKSVSPPKNSPETISSSARMKVSDISINRTPINTTAEEAEMRPYYILIKSDAAQAKLFLDNILLIHPNNVIAIREKGIQKLFENNYQDAIALFDKAWLIKHQDELLLLLGEAWLRAKNVTQAESWFSQAAQSSNLIIKTQAQSALNLLQKGEVSSTPALLKPLDAYYLLKDIRPEIAIHILSEMAKIQPNNSALQTEMGYHFLKTKEPTKALPYFLRAHDIESQRADITLQIAYIYILLKDKIKAEEFFKLASQSSDPAALNKAKEGLKMLKPGQNIPATSPTLPGLTAASAAAVPATISPYDKMMNLYYSLQKEHPLEAQKVLQQIINQYPTNYRALKEMGYLMIRLKNNKAAISYFTQAWNLQPQKSADLALQIGYLLDGLGQKRAAFSWFKRSFTSQDKDISRKSYASMVNLAGVRFQLFDPPWFADLWSAPFYYSRFDLFVVPEHLRVGRTFGKRKQVEVYYNNYANKDNRSRAATFGLLPSIFDDDYVLNGAGIRYYTQTKLPVIFYFEAGKAYDLVYRNRDRWRNDYRGGLLSWYAWGPLPEYTTHFTFPFTKWDDFYLDSTWFSRYNSDWITYARYRKGLRVFEYRNFSVAAYARGFIIADTNRYFYNNLFEYGPGIAFFPNNTWPVAFRLERRFGQYISVNSPDPNPYGSSYVSNVAMFEMYFRF